MDTRNRQISAALWALVALALAAGLKLWLAAGGWVPFNADEAVVALMARHILQGARPVFFYGQAYMGSLDAFLVAGAFALLGQQVWAVRLVQAMLYLGVLGTTGLLGKAAFGSGQVGLLAMLLLAVPAVNVTLYTTASLGGYGEALLIGNLILLVGMRIAVRLCLEDQPPPYWLWLLLGALCGLGLWAFGLTLVYSLPVLVYLLGRLVIRRNSIPSTKVNPVSYKWVAVLALMAGAFLGSAPWWGFAFRNGFQKLLWELGGGAIAGVENLPWILQVARHAVNFLVLGITVTLGFRPPWDVSWLGLPLLPFVLIFWMGVMLYIIRCLRRESSYRQAQRLLFGVILALLAGFILTPFGADPSGRYFLPLAVPLSLFAAAMILELEKKVGSWAYALLALVLMYNLWGTIQSALRFPPGLSTQFYAPSQVDHRYDQALVDFLRQQGETRGYTNYWVAYPLAFLSGEQLIFIPRLPYHLDFRYTRRDDRYVAYDAWVNNSYHVAYITANHPDLDSRLRQEFSGLGVTWQERQIGDYTVFYRLSSPLRPQDIGLGTTTSP